jgi:hypothetical protein
VREQEAAKRLSDAQLLEAQRTEAFHQSSLSELQAKMELLHDSSSSSQSKLQARKTTKSMGLICP